MITPPPPLVRVYLACGCTDMRKDVVTLAIMLQQTLGHDPFCGARRRATDPILAPGRVRAAPP